MKRRVVIVVHRISTLHSRKSRGKKKKKKKKKHKSLSTGRGREEGFFGSVNRAHFCPSHVGTVLGVTKVTWVARLSGGCWSEDAAFEPMIGARFAPDRLRYAAYMPDPATAPACCCWGPPPGPATPAAVTAAAPRAAPVLPRSLDVGDLVRRPRRMILPVVINRPKPSWKFEHENTNVD